MEGLKGLGSSKIQPRLSRGRLFTWQAARPILSKSYSPFKVTLPMIEELEGELGAEADFNGENTWTELSED